MREQIKIRKAEFGDIPRIVDIYNDALLTSAYVQDNHPHTIEKRSNWYYQKQSEGLPIFVAIKNSIEVVGFANLNPFLTPEYDTTVHISVYVAETNRGLGIGKALIEELIKWSKDNQKHTILAGIDAENIPSIRLHQTFGFIEVASFKEVISKFGGFKLLSIDAQLVCLSSKHGRQMKKYIK